MDLLSADLQAMATYISYFYCMSKIWSTPLPEVYDAELVSNYFKCRPHIIAFRLLEVLKILMLMLFIKADQQLVVSETCLSTSLFALKWIT